MGDPTSVKTVGRRAPWVAAAAALAALGAAAHHHASHSHFTLQEVRVLTDPMASAEGRAVIGLPDLGVLRGGPVVVRGDVDSASSDDLEVEVRLDGFRQADAGVAAGSAASFAFVLRGGTADAVTGGGDHQIELVGRPDAWRLTSLVAANARAVLGHGRIGAIVPREVEPDSRLAPVEVVLFLVLALAAAAWGVTFPAARARRAHWWFAALSVAAATIPGPCFRSSASRSVAARRSSWTTASASSSVADASR